MNLAARRLLDITSPEQGLFLDLIQLEDSPGLAQAFKSALESRQGESFRSEFTPFRKSNYGVFKSDGRVSPALRIQAHIKANRGEDGKLWLAINLSEKREVGAKSQLLDLLLEKLPIMACRIDEKGVFLESRGQALRAAGLQDNQAVGMNALEGWPDCRQYLEKAIQGESVHFEFTVGDDSQKRIQEIWFTPNPAGGGAIGFGVDVTPRKKVEEELSKSEAFSRRIIESSRDCIMVLGADGTLLSINNCGRTLMEIENPDVFLNRSWLEFWCWEDRVKAGSAFNSASLTGVGKFQGYCLSGTGQPKWWDVIITPILNPSWEPERLLAVCRDVTETKQFQESLCRTKEQLEAILRAISDAVVVSDAKGKVVFANDAGARLDWPAILSADELLSDPPPRQVVRLIEKQNRWLVVNSATVRDSEGQINLIIHTAHDFTERKVAEEALHRSEEQLRQAQKMEAVGRLAGGVAHDFNNLLTAINGYSELLKISLRENDPLHATVEEILRAGERAATLTRQLLTFSRRQVLAPRVLDLNHVLAELRQMLGRLIGEDIHLITVADPLLGKINTDPGQMEQVILNLALNARDAMPIGGRLTIETANVLLESFQAGSYFPVEPGNYIRLTVTDTGLGMKDDVKAHLFEPFFTTKPPGQGTGLGLSTVYGIVKSAGGNLSVSTAVDKGTTFSVYFPAVKSVKPAKVAKQDDEINHDLEIYEPKANIIDERSSRETILLVEDEDMVRRLITQVLLSHGYKVLEASSGAAALEVAERNSGKIDLLLTDVVMGGMSGRELSEKLILVRPDLTVLYMSGYTDDATLRHGVFQDSTAFLCKPFSPDILIRKIREVISKSKSAWGKSAPL